MTGVGIVGAVRLGQAMARVATRAGRSVVIANSRGPESLAHEVSALGQRVSAGTMDEAASAGIVVIAVPWDRVGDAVQGLNWNGQIVIDATNDWAADDLHGRTSSEILADLVADARLVKAANTLSAEVLGSDPHHAGGQRVIFISGDDNDAKRKSPPCSRTRASPRSTSVIWQQAARCSKSTTPSPAST